MKKNPKFETGNVGVQFTGKPKAANKNDEVLEKMVNSPFAEHRNNPK
jgi:hypothetical protein